MEQAWRAAQLANDVPAMDKLLSDDYVGITMTGQVVTKHQQLDRMRNRQLVLTRIDMDDMKVKLIGSTAVVTSLINIDGTMEGSDVHGMYRYTRVYTPPALRLLENHQLRGHPREPARWPDRRPAPPPHPPRCRRTRPAEAVMSPGPNFRSRWPKGPTG